MAIKAYFNFDGNCREAAEYYAKVFETEDPKILTFGDMPPQEGFEQPEELKKRVLHAEVKLKDATLLFSDTFPGMDFVVGNNINLYYSSTDIDEIKRVFNKLQEEGTVSMELQETFWSKCYGSVVDKFGTVWQLGYETDH